MAVISLENMRFFAHHGLYEEEKILGNFFVVNISISTNTSGATTIEEHGVRKVVKTVNYETVYQIIRLEMNKPQYLLETVMSNIIDALKKQFSDIAALEISISKLNPPLGGQVGASRLSDAEDYTTRCGRCGKGLVCYGDKNCWCNTDRTRLHPRTLEMLEGQYKGCLCQKCLDEFSG